MIKSMTGFGRVREVENGREITAEIKSVNNRYMDISVRASKIYGFLDEKVRREALKYISRGKIEIYIGIEGKNSSSTNLTLNEAYLENYIAVIKKICGEYNLPDDISAMRLAYNRDIFNIEKLEEDEELIWQEVKSALEKAFADFNKMRETEGGKLLGDILSRIENCGRIADEIKNLAQECKNNYYETFKQKLKDIIGDAGIVLDENRILTECAVYADKIEITEEIVRIKSHFSQFEKITRETGPVGRKLEFLTQEINREINTIGSKSPELEITNRVIEIKSDMEKIREQIQNIE